MNSIRTLRLLGLLEGLSFLVLLFVAMPLKYLLHEPGAVRVVGGVHGFLFLAFVAALFSTAMDRSWALPKSLQLFVASLIPFGFVWMDRRLRAAEA